jgi:hypothetical protein
MGSGSALRCGGFVESRLPGVSGGRGFDLDLSRFAILFPEIRRLGDVVLIR